MKSLKVMKENLLVVEPSTDKHRKDEYIVWGKFSVPQSKKKVLGQEIV